MLWDWRVVTFIFPQPPRHSSLYHREFRVAPGLTVTLKCFGWSAPTRSVLTSAELQQKICSDCLFPGTRLTLQTVFGTFLHTQGPQEHKIVQDQTVDKGPDGWSLLHWENFDGIKSQIRMWPYVVGFFTTFSWDQPKSFVVCLKPEVADWAVKREPRWFEDHWRGNMQDVVRYLHTTTPHLSVCAYKCVCVAMNGTIFSAFTHLGSAGVTPVNYTHRHTHWG